MRHLIQTSHGMDLTLWVERPTTSPKGCLIVLHEAFGVTSHIQRVCAEYAALGYLCAAPAMLAYSSGNPDGEVLPQTKEGLDRGRDLILATPLTEVQAMMAAVQTWAQGQGLASATLGYCWGGSCAYFGGTCLPGLKAAISYYGGQLAQLAAAAQPSCPTLIHLATLDRYIPLAETCAAFAAHHPAAQVHVYEADHGFNRDDGKTYDPAISALAKERTLQVLEKAFL